MGVRNYLVEGVSGTGKTAVCAELARRGYQALNGDQDLAYQGDPKTGLPTATATHENHLWDVSKVVAVIRDKSSDASYLCGGSRNFEQFIHLFDEVFVLEVDSDTLMRRLEARPGDEFGGSENDRDFILQLHLSKSDVPQNGIVVDATAPLERVVDDILRKSAGTS